MGIARRLSDRFGSLGLAEWSLTETIAAGEIGSGTWESQNAIGRLYGESNQPRM